MSLLHPEVEHLLAEIAADPNSSLLRIPRTKVLPELFRPPDPIRQSAYFLTSAERHLLAVHREEVAHWLRVGLVFARTQGKRLGKTWFASNEVGQRAWIAKQSEIAAGGHLGEEVRTWVHHPNLWLSDEARALQVQAAAQRLVPSPLAPVVSAQLLTGLGDYATALRLLREGQPALRGSGLTTAVESSFGVVGWRLGRHADAAASYERAWLENPARDVYLAAAALNGALAGGVSPAVASAFPGQVPASVLQHLWSSAMAHTPPGLDGNLRQARLSGVRSIRDVMEAFDEA